MNSGGLVTMFQEGGWSMYPITLFGLLAIVFAAIHVKEGKASGLFPATAITAFTALFGVFGTYQARRVVDEAVAMVDPSMVEELRRIGMLEAQRPTQLAGILVVPAIVLLVVAEVRRRGRDGAATD